MSLVKLKPGMDASFFEQLAQVGDPLLLTSAMTMAVRRDYQSLHALVDFLEDSMGEVGFLIDNTQMSVNAPSSQGDAGPHGKVYKNATFTRVFALAFSMDAEDSSQNQEVSCQDALALAKRVAHLYSSPKAIEHKLNLQMDLLLQHASSLAVSQEVLQVLVQTGADPGRKMTSSHGVDSMTTPMLEAMLAGNFKTANYLMVLTPSEVVEDFLWLAIKKTRKNGTTVSQEFSKSIGVEQLCSAIRDQTKEVDVFLKSIDEKTKEMKLFDKYMSKPSSVFRMQLASSFLQKIASNYGERWKKEEVLALLGSPGDAVNLGIQSVLDGFSKEITPEPSFDDVDPDKWKSYAPSHAECKFEDPRADFVYQVLRTHCLAGITLSKEVLVAEEAEGLGKGFGVEHAIDGKMMETGDASVPWSFSPSAFQEVLGFFKGIGVDLNDLPKGGSALHLLADSPRPEALSMLPILLDFGVDPKVRDRFDNLAFDKIDSDIYPTRGAQWIQICHSHAARSSAMSLIEQIEHEEHKASKPS